MLGMNDMTSELERGPAAGLWRGAVVKIPTVYGRLTLLSGLRNENTGRYEHHGLSLRYGDETATRVLEQSHWEIFQRWLAQPLEEKKRDLAAYWSGLEQSQPDLVAAWLRLRPYRQLVPAAAREAERELFWRDCDVLLEVFRIECGVDAPDPDE
ncbi:MAG TPA: hypothetical protein DEH78_11005 [Solibacterales bacterium]|nr:hypothetical protein [Bryobacterales bacterium]